MDHSLIAFGAERQSSNGQQVDEQEAKYYTQEHQLDRCRRVVMQEEMMLADSPTLEVVHHALTSVEARAQHRATKTEHQLNIFMNTTYGTVTEVERKLQERLEAALQTTQSEVLATAADATRDIHERPNFKRVKINLTRRSRQLVKSLEETVISETEARVAEAESMFELEIAATRQDAIDRVSLLKARMQLKLDDAIKASACARDDVVKLVDDANQELAHLVDSKFQVSETYIHNILDIEAAKLENKIHNRVDVEAMRLQNKLQLALEAHVHDHVRLEDTQLENKFRNNVDTQVMKLENKMQFALNAAMEAVQSCTSERLASFDARLSENLHTVEFQVQNEIKSCMDRSLSKIEQRLNSLLQASNSQLSTATTKQITDGISRAETRIGQTQQLLHQKLRTEQTKALNQIEARLQEILRTSRAAQDAKVEIAINIMEKQIEKRLAATLSRDIVDGRQSTNELSKNDEKHVQEKLLVTTTYHQDGTRAGKPLASHDHFTIYLQRSCYDVDATPPSTPPNTTARI